MHFEFDNPEIANAFDVLFKGFFKATWFWWKVWILAAELRILIQMFLNINPYFYPVYYLWLGTDPMFNFGRKLYPKILGLDLCPLINFTIAQKIEAQLDLFAHGIDKFNRYKFERPDQTIASSELWRGANSSSGDLGFLAILDNAHLSNLSDYFC